MIYYSYDSYLFIVPGTEFDNIYKSIIQRFYLYTSKEITPKQVIAYFKKNYPEIKKRLTEFAGFSVRVRTKSDYPDIWDSTYYLEASTFGIDVHDDSMRVEVKMYDKVMEEAIKNKSSTKPGDEKDPTTPTDPSNPGDDTETPGLGEIPKAGLTGEGLIYILMVLIVMSSIGMIYMIKTNKK